MSRPGSPFEIPEEGAGRPVLVFGMQIGKRPLSPTATAITSPIKKMLTAVRSGALRAVGRTAAAAPARAIPTRNLSAVELAAFETEVLEQIYEHILQHSKL